MAAWRFGFGGDCRLLCQPIAPLFSLIDVRLKFLAVSINEGCDRN
jgi:hypothetical protein